MNIIVLEMHKRNLIGLERRAFCKAAPRWLLWNDLTRELMNMEKLDSSILYTRTQYGTSVQL